MEVVHMKIRNSVLCIMIICVFVLFNSDGAFGGSPNAPLNRELLAKAQPDECFHGIGWGYDPDPTCSLDNGAPSGVPKVNQAYVWGLTKNGPKVWWGTVANMVCVVGGMILDASPIQLDSMQTTAWVCEYGNSKFPPAANLPPGMGDWRPPKVYSYDTASSAQEDKTPQHPLINMTWGLRSAGTLGDVVFLAGPGLGSFITMFAFKSSTGAFLGAQQFTDYTDIREWLTADGELYAGVQNASDGTGSVIRWIGWEGDPFKFEVVGTLDASAANLAYHDGRIFVNTWPSQNQMFGPNPVFTSLYMSPKIDCGLPPSKEEWTKVWSITDYEPDPLATHYQMGGALRSYKGALYWGTMLIPVAGLLYAISTPDMDLDANGNGSIDIDELLTTLVGTHRSVTLFRGKGFGTKYQKMQVLYGEKYLPVYDPAKKKYTIGSDAVHRNRMPDPVPKYGHAGFNNPFNTYIWSMGVYDDKLFIGTFDWSYLFYQGLVDMAIRPSFPELADKLTGLAKMKPPFKDFPIQFGADLYKFVNSNSAAKAESRDGVGNFSNYGVRTLVGDETGLYVGTANAMNLLTDPFDDLPEGGWELLRLTK